MKKSNSIEFSILNKKSKMRILDNGIMHTVFLEGTFFEVEDVEAIRNGYLSFPEPRPMKAIQEFELGASMSPESRIYAAEHSPDLQGVAYVVTGLSQRLIVRFYVRMWKRKKPAKVFENFNAALDWLNSI